MKNFIFTIEQGNSPKDGSGRKKTAKVWQISKNKPVFVGELTDSFIDDNQIVMQILEDNKSLPKKYFQRNSNTGSRIYGIVKLRDEGIADLLQL